MPRPKLEIPEDVARLSIRLPRKLGWWLIVHCSKISDDGINWKNTSKINFYFLFVFLSELLLPIVILALFLILGIIV